MKGLGVAGSEGEEGVAEGESKEEEEEKGGVEGEAKGGDEGQGESKDGEVKGEVAAEGGVRGEEVVDKAATGQVSSPLPCPTLEPTKHDWLSRFCMKMVCAALQSSLPQPLNSSERWLRSPYCLT